MKLSDVLNISEEWSAGTVPPTQLSPTQDLNYQHRHWDGDRPEYVPKDKFVTKGKQKDKKRKKGTVKKIGLMITKVEYGDDPDTEDSSYNIEQYNPTRTRDVPPNYLNMSLSPFFMKADDEFEYDQKDSHITKPSKKKGKKSARRTKRNSNKSK